MERLFKIESAMERIENNQECHNEKLDSLKERQAENSDKLDELKVKCDSLFDMIHGKDDAPGFKGRLAAAESRMRRWVWWLRLFITAAVGSAVAWVFTKHT